MQVEGKVVLEKESNQKCLFSFLLVLCANQDRQGLPLLIVGSQDVEAYDEVQVVDCQL